MATRYAGGEAVARASMNNRRHPVTTLWVAPSVSRCYTFANVVAVAYLAGCAPRARFGCTLWRQHAGCEAAARRRGEPVAAGGPSVPGLGSRAWCRAS